MLVRKPQGIGHVGNLSIYRRIISKCIIRKGGEQNELVQDKIQWPASVDIVTDIQVP
jgi:hypothetical protein